MKIRYFAALAVASFIGLSSASLPSAFSPAHANPCAANPCAAVDPCAANPCAANPCAAVDPCAANPCAAVDPCAANPCAAVDPCAANPCAAVDPCAANPCAAVDPCAANPCAAVDPCAANPCAANPCAAVDPCAANPCAAVDPCAANPCAAVDPCAGADPCAAAVTNAAPKIYSDPQLDQQAGKTLAIRGYDPVAYFSAGQPTEGSSTYQYEWNGAVWQFSSAANRAAFAADPEAFAPQYGGYCAKALSEGNLASIDPTAWRIVDGKLYLNYSAAVQQQWVQDIAGNIDLADSNWPDILTTPATVYYDTVGAIQY